MAALLNGLLRSSVIAASIAAARLLRRMLGESTSGHPWPH